MEFLYPPIEPRLHGWLDVGDGHEIYLRSRGTPMASPASSYTEVREAGHRPKVGNFLIPSGIELSCLTSGAAVGHVPMPH